MINLDTEYFSSPYYFYLTEKKDNYNLYFSVNDSLNEARDSDKMVKISKDKIDKVKKFLEKLLKSKDKKESENVEGELEELVNADGNLINSKIPILDPKMHPRKTLDQTVAAARQTNDPFFRGRSYRSYFGESDMSGVFGYDDTSGMTGNETFEYYKDELEMEPDEAKKRTEEQGKDPSGKKDKKSKFYNDKNFVTRATISELQKKKAIKVLEDILVKKGKDNSEVDKSVEIEELPKEVKNHLNSLKSYAKSKGLTMKQLTKLLDNE